MIDNEQNVYKPATKCAETMNHDQVLRFLNIAINECKFVIIHRSKHPQVIQLIGSKFPDMSFAEKKWREDKMHHIDIMTHAVVCDDTIEVITDKGQTVFDTTKITSIEIVDAYEQFKHEYECHHLTEGNSHG